MDPMAIAGMLFVLIMLAMVSGFILLLPISRRLGAYLEQRLTHGRAGGVPPEQLTELRELVLSLQSQVESISERQEFTDRLLTDGEGTGGRGRALGGARPLEP